MAAAGPSRPTEMINASAPSLKARLDLTLTAPRNFKMLIY